MKNGIKVNMHEESSTTVEGLLLGNNLFFRQV